MVARRAHNPKVTGSSPVSATKGLVVKWFNTPPCHGGDRGFDPRLDRHYGSVAQSVEQQIEALCVAGSIPAGATISFKMTEKIRVIQANYSYFFDFILKLAII